MYRPGRVRFRALAGVALAVAYMAAVVARSGAADGSGLEMQAPAQAAPPSTPAQQEPPPPTPPPGMRLPPISPKQAGSGYVGDETCLTCHEEQKKGYSDTMHGRTDHPRAPGAKMGCETCHGPGAKHSEDETIPGLIYAFKKEPPREGNETCLSCHARGTHALWEGSVHDSRNLSCATCHSVHKFKSERAQLKTAREMDTCAPCHRDKVAKVDRSGHMPLREGKMECSTCHNPHGSTSVKQLRKGDSIAELCTSCHADKRGPYLWEHAPTRDGCATCHDPHGSSNERMLVTKPPLFCQRCHVATRHPSTIYDGALIGSGQSPSIRIYARSCVTCHVNIHGSNHPSGQRFVR
jgi:DmsE family decaheme c-type cytochrome